MQQKQTQTITQPSQNIQKQQIQHFIQQKSNQPKQITNYTTQTIQNQFVNKQSQPQILDKSKLIKDQQQQFGAQLLETEEDLEKRKKKIFNTPIFVDQETVNKRIQKFGGEIKAENIFILEERQKKFGSTNIISLDDEIQKNKQRTLRNKNYFRNKHHKFKNRPTRPHNHQSRDKDENNQKTFNI